MKTNKIKTAVSDIVDFQCCPLYLRNLEIKSDAGSKFLSELPKAYKQLAYRWIERLIDDYHTPIPGFEGMSPSDMNELVLRN